MHNLNSAVMDARNVERGTQLQLDDLPIEFQANCKKVYFERSPYAEIEALDNGLFRVANKVNGCTYVPCRTWFAAKYERDFMSQYYRSLEFGRF